MGIKQKELDINSKLTEEIGVLHSKALRESDETKRLKQLLEVITFINKTLLSVKDKNELLQKICKVLTEFEDCKIVWVGLLDKSGRKIVPVACSGFKNNNLSAIKISGLKKDPIIDVIKYKKPIFIKDLKKESRYKWREAAIKNNCCSSITLPISIEKDIVGILGIYSTKREPFNPFNVKFLEEVAGDIAIGIKSIEIKERLLKSEERFKELVNQLPESVFEMDTKGNITFTNYNASSDFGYTQDDIYKGINVLDLVLPQERKRLKLTLKKLLSGKNPGLTEFLALRSDGSSFPVIVNANTIKNKEGKVVGIRGILVDITQRKKLLEQIKLSEAKYRAIFENNSTATIIVSEDKTITLVNSTFEKISGFKRAEIEGKKKWTEFVSKKDLAKMKKYHKLRRVDLDAAPGSYEFEFINRHGESKNIILSVEMIPHTKSSIASLLDITQQRKTSERLARSYDRLRNTLDATIDMIGAIIETRDFYTAGHQKRVAELSVEIASRMEISKERIEILRMAATVHDLGKISTPAEILSRPGKISEAEFSIIKEHPQIGYNIIKMVNFPISIAEIILQHHERLNGSGYPRGLKGKNILLEAKILAVADSVEAMAYHRPYRPAMGLDKAIEELERNKGKLFDRKVVDVCVEILKSKSFKL